MRPSSKSPRHRWSPLPTSNSETAPPQPSNPHGETRMFDLSKIECVYSGRKGCMCGCRGKYSYASAFKSERPSYYDADEGVSDRSVKTITRRVEEFLRDGQDVGNVMVDANGDWLSVNMEHDR